MTCGPRCEREFLCETLVISLCKFVCKRHIWVGSVIRQVVVSLTFLAC